MTAQRPSRIMLPAVLILAIILLGAAWLNYQAKREAADLPGEYHMPYMSMQYQSAQAKAVRSVQALDGQRIISDRYLPYLLTDFRHGDTVRVLDANEDASAERKVVLVPQFSAFDLFTYIAVGMVFLFFAVAVTFRYRARPYAGVLVSVAIATAAMVLLDWGTLRLHSTTVNFLLRFLFDSAIWLLPSLFFHFSCSYPSEKPIPKRYFLLPWYMLSAFGIVLSAIYLVSLFYQGVPVQHTFYVELHGVVNDVFLVTGLLATVANFEHSALRMESARQRKNVYWVLLGVILGPLVYVFMILVPRTLMGHEFVSDTVMEYTLLAAPIMFWTALRRDGYS
jgi:hypothetical protein